VQGVAVSKIAGFVHAQGNGLPEGEQTVFG